MEKPEMNDDEKFLIRVQYLVLAMEDLNKLTDEYMAPEDEIIQKAVDAGAKKEDAQREINLRNWKRYETKRKCSRMFDKMQHTLGIMINDIDAKLKTMELMNKK